MFNKNELPLRQSIDEEIRNGMYSAETLTEKVLSKEAVVLKGRGKSIVVGEGFPIRLTSLFGVNSATMVGYEKSKIEGIAKLPYAPDCMMDLSILNSDEKLYEFMIDVFDGPVGTVPLYHLAEEKLEKGKILDFISESVDKGISFLTLHAAVDKETFDLAKKRRVPLTSRGGYMMVKDMMERGANKGLLYEIFDDVLDVLEGTGVSISLGTSFRSASISEFLDEAYLSELKLQKQFIQAAHNRNIGVVMEIGSHMGIEHIAGLSEALKDYNIPFTPLGPLMTESATGYDDQAFASSLPLLAYNGLAHISAIITNVEHKGGFPRYNSIEDALISARIAAQIFNRQFPFYKKWEEDLEKSNLYSCIKHKEQYGCDRCGPICPYNIKRDLK